MREIKFRVWDKSLKYMRCLSSSHDTLMFDEKGGHYYNLQNGDGNSFEDSGYSELMQNAGIKDKNDKEIYEGDIVKSPCGIHKVIFVDGGFCLDTGELAVGLYQMIDSQGNHLEVVGNIYENPELLEVEK